MLQAAARRALPALARPAGQVPRALAAGASPKKPAEDDDDTYQLLPPGCSLTDPTYGRTFDGSKSSLSDPVVIYDQKPVEDYQPLKKRQSMPAPPLNVAAAQAKLQQSKDAKKRADAGEDEDDLYVYLPPGSSMRDPVALPNSMSDPLDSRKVYYRDPSPTIRSK